MSTDVCGLFQITHLPTKSAYISPSLAVLQRLRDHYRLLNHGLHHCLPLQALCRNTAAGIYAVNMADFNLAVLHECAPSDLTNVANQMTAAVLRTSTAVGQDGKLLLHGVTILNLLPDSQVLHSLPDDWRTALGADGTIDGTGGLYKRLRDCERNVHTPLVAATHEMRLEQRAARKRIQAIAQRERREAKAKARRERLALLRNSERVDLAAAVPDNPAVAAATTASAFNSIARAATGARSVPGMGAGIAAKLDKLIKGED